MKSSQKDQKEHGSQFWQCDVCTFRNYPKVGECQMCGKTRVVDGDGKGDHKGVEKMEGEPRTGFRCHACHRALDDLVSKCPGCGQILIPEQSEDQQKVIKPSKQKPADSKESLIKCPSCNQSNDPNNQTCVFCQQNLQQKAQTQLIPIKKRARKPKPYKPRSYGRAYHGMSTCRYCHMAIYSHMSSIQDHQEICMQMGEEERHTKFVSIPKKYCAFCYEKFQPEDYDKHDVQCKSRKQFFSQQTPTYERCTKLQKQTMFYMHNKSQKLHWIAQKTLIKKISALGYKQSDLENLHHYIVNYAPIIIHMHVSKHMQFFVKDTHYRNQFETKKSSGSLSETSRISWEDRMFDRKHHSAKPFQRVKYGTINFTNDPKGVRACVGYGQSYFLLKPHVRNRCTVTDMDSSSPSATIATFQFCYHLLAKLPDAELKAAFQGSKANEVASNVIGSYKQIQIHGPVQFKYDIQRVYVNKAQLLDPANEKLVKQFCKRNDLQYQVFQYETVAASSAFGFGGASGLFAAPPPLISSFSFAPPVSTASTAHLFGGGAFGRIPARGLTVPPVRTQPEKQPQQGVDYI